MLSKRETNLREAIQEHVFWNRGSDHAWEEGTEVLMDNSLFEALVQLAAAASDANVRAFIAWLETE